MKWEENGIRSEIVTKKLFLLDIWFKRKWKENGNHYYEQMNFLTCGNRKQQTRGVHYHQVMAKTKEWLNQIKRKWVDIQLRFLESKKCWTKHANSTWNLGQRILDLYDTVTFVWQYMIKTSVSLTLFEVRRTEGENIFAICKRNRRLSQPYQWKVSLFYNKCKKDAQFLQKWKKRWEKKS